MFTNLWLSFQYLLYQWLLVWFIAEESYYYLAEDDQISKAELRLTDIADALQGDWVVLGRQLEITDDEIAKIQSEYNYVGEQSLVMLHLWVQKNGENATGNSLERALRKIGREDVIRKCMYNIEEVTDEVERAVAKVHIDQPGKFLVILDLFISIPNIPSHLLPTNNPQLSSSPDLYVFGCHVTILL